MRKTVYILLFIIVQNGFEIGKCVAQTYAPRSYYLVDSLVLDELTQADRTLLDSCLKVYHSAKQDTDRINALDNVCDFLVHDIWSDYQFVQYKLVKEALQNNPNKKVRHYLKSTLSVSLNNIGLYYEKHIGNTPKALGYYLKSLQLYEELNNQLGVAILLNRIGQVYFYQNDKDKALEYYHKSLKIFEKLGDRTELSNPLNNIGIYYKDKGDYPLALKYLNESLKIDEEAGNQQGIATSLSNIGRVYLYAKKYDKALIYFIKGLKVFEQMGDQSGISLVLCNIGDVYLTQGDTKSALVNAIRSFEIAQKIGFPDKISTSALLLSQIYEKQNKKGKALKMFKLYTAVKDSVTNENTRTDAIKQQSKYEYEKQKAIDGAVYEKQIAIDKKTKEKQTIIIYAIGGGISLLAIFLIFIFNRLQVTRKQKNLIEHQKKDVEKAHKELSEKNKEITDSIKYAKRIQSAILPPNKVVKEYLPKSFILYKPKDIVAGDFYWLEHKEGKILFAAADCTGHGVPGAMVSVVCNNALNRSVREHGLTKPGEILDKTREIVIQEFEKSDEEVRDGMDIALCSLEFEVESSELKEKTKNSKPETAITLQYAGAHNPLWIIRNGEIIETKASKQPIGKFDNPLPYTSHFYELQKNDTIYIFSDGYADQFGGKKAKKFKAKAFKKLLLSIQDEPIEKQGDLLNDAFENWKGDLEQIDDVCVIGVKI